MMKKDNGYIKPVKGSNSESGSWEQSKVMMVANSTSTGSTPATTAPAKRTRRLTVTRFDFITKLIASAIFIVIAVGFFYAFYSGREFQVRTFAEGFFSENFAASWNFSETLAEINEGWPDWLSWAKVVFMPIITITLASGYVIVWAFSAFAYIMTA